MSEPRGRPFLAGNKMGRGRPRGSLNKSSSPGQDVLNEYAAKLMLKCISMAGQGDIGAMRLCLERILPVRRDALVRVSLPRIGTAQDVNKAAEKVMQGMGRGKITATDGEKMMNVLQMRSHIIDSVKVESRIAELEESVDAADKRPRAA
jgi:hypothetical protein